MTNRISRQPLPQPLGRRRPPAAAKSKQEDSARDLLASVNSASEGATATWLAFLGTMAYLAVTLGGVTHFDLLLNNDTTLPFVNVKVPLETFFVMAPLAFVLVHFSLLLQHVMLSRKLAAFEARVAKEEPSRNRNTQNIRDELHSYTFSQAVSGMPKSAAVDLAQRLVMSLTLVIFPLLLLTFFQIGFLPFHTGPITWWHRIILLADVGIVVVLARHLAWRDRETKVTLTNWWEGMSASKAKFIVSWRKWLHNRRARVANISLPLGGKDYGAGTAAAVRVLLKWIRSGGKRVLRALSPGSVVIMLLMFFSICVATLPDNGDEWVPLDRWMASIPSLSTPLPYGRTTTEKGIDGREQPIHCPSHDGTTRCAFILTASLFEHEVDETSGKSDSVLGWSRNLIVTDKDLAGGDDEKKQDDKNGDAKKEKTINLRGRDLRYAALDRSNLRHADFYRGKLQGARLFETKLNGANFVLADLRSADLRRAKLQGAALHWVSLQGAVLRWADLQGAILKDAELQGADISSANLQGAELTGAKLQGANLAGAHLRGADLREAHLQVADLRTANLQGADLRGARLQGANLRAASLQGADLLEARLWKSYAPNRGSSPVGAAEWTLVSARRVRMRPLDEEEREELGGQLEQLQQRMESGPTQVEGAAKSPAARIGVFLRTKDDDKWMVGEERNAWCKLAKQPMNQTKLSSYLGALACGDDTNKGYIAQRLIARVLDGAPSAFLEIFKDCSAFTLIPADLKSRLERAARADGTKATANGKLDPPMPSEVPAVCVENPATTNASAPSTP
jgi:uncharacterized protein YjbI with pentapeptide repeats